MSSSRVGAVGRRGERGGGGGGGGSSSGSGGFYRRVARWGVWGAVGLVGVGLGLGGLGLGVGLISERLADDPEASTGRWYDPNEMVLLRTSRQLLRGARVCYVMAGVSFDYKYSLRNLEFGTEDYRRVRSEVHFRAANKLLWLAVRNKGIFVKSGQFIASMTHVLPPEYTSTLSVLQDRVESRPVHELHHVIQKELGLPYDSLFEEFDPIPLGTASIAQVHRAKIWSTGREVAVKVQHHGLESISRSDLKTLDLLAPVVSYLFPSFEFGWILPEFESAVNQELDFINEGRNAERCARNFQGNPSLKVPDIIWSLTTKRVLVMEFEEGVKVTNREKLKEMGIDKNEVARLLIQVFADQVFKYGFVHSDPHPGNILIRPMHPGSKKPVLVLLDHGLYKELGESFRVNYAYLWQALVMRDKERIEHYGRKLGAGQFSGILAMILTLRPSDSWVFRKDLSKRITEGERKKLVAEAATIRGSFFEFLEGLPRELLFVFKTLALLRSINRALESDVAAPLVMARTSLYSVVRDSGEGLIGRLKYLFYRFEFELRLQMFSLLSWLSWLQ